MKNLFLFFLIFTFVLFSVGLEINVISKSDFDTAGAIYDNVVSNESGYLELDLEDIDNYYSEGSYTSPIFEVDDDVSWTKFSWNEPINYGGDGYPNFKDSTSSIDMSENVLLLHFDEESGNVLDYSGSNNHPYYTNLSSYEIISNFNSSVYFNGNSDTLLIEDSSDLDLNQNWSIEVWLKLDEINRMQSVLSKGSYSLKVNEDDIPFFEIISDDITTSVTKVGTSICGGSGNRIVSSIKVYNNKLYALCTANQSFRRYDGGTTWTNIWAQNLSRMYINMIAYDGNMYLAATNPSNNPDNGVIWRYNESNITMVRNRHSNIFQYGLIMYNNLPLYPLERQNFNNELRYFRPYHTCTVSCDPARHDSDVLKYTYPSTNTNGKDLPQSMIVYDGNLFTALTADKKYIYTTDGSETVGGAYISNTDSWDTTNTANAFSVFQDSIYVCGSDQKLYTKDRDSSWGLVSNDSVCSANTPAVEYNNKLYTNRTNNLLYTYDGSSVSSTNMFTNWSTTNGEYITSMAKFKGKLYLGSNLGNIYVLGKGESVTSNNKLTSDYSHIAITYDGEFLKFYHDGILQNEVETDSSIIENDFDLLIGNSYGSSFSGATSYGYSGFNYQPYHNTGEENFRGYMDELAIYNRVLSEEEIITRANAVKRDLRFKIRSCSIQDCSDSDFVGIDGTSESYFSIGNTEYDISQIVSNNRYFQYIAYFNTEDTLVLNDMGVILDDVNISYNRKPDVNFIQIRAQEDFGLEYYSRFREGSLFVDFNVYDEDNDTLYITAYANTTQSPSGARNILSRRNLSSLCAGDYNTTSDCTFTWNLSTILDINPHQDMYVIIYIEDDYGENYAYSQSTYRIDNTPTDPLVNITSIYLNDLDTEFDKILSYNIDKNINIDFNLYDSENDNLDLTFYLYNTVNEEYLAIQEIDSKTSFFGSGGNIISYSCDSYNFTTTRDCTIKWNLYNAPTGIFKFFIDASKFSTFDSNSLFSKLLFIDNDPPSLDVNNTDGWSNSGINISIDNWIPPEIDLSDESCEFTYMCRIFGPNYGPPDENLSQDTGWYNCTSTQGITYLPNYGLGNYTLDTNYHNSCTDEWTYITRNFYRAPSYTPPSDAPDNPQDYVLEEQEGVCTVFDYNYSCRVRTEFGSLLFGYIKPIFNEWYTCNGAISTSNLASGEYYLDINIEDCSGNITTNTTHYQKDITFPQMEISNALNCEDNSSWINEYIDPVIGCLDSESGCKTTYFQYDLDRTQNKLFSDFNFVNSSGVTLSYIDYFNDDGYFSIRYYGIDNVDNNSAEFYGISETNLCVDTKKPIISISLSDELDIYGRIDNNSLISVDINKIEHSDINLGVVYIGLQKLSSDSVILGDYNNFVSINSDEFGLIEFYQNSTFSSVDDVVLEDDIYSYIFEENLLREDSDYNLIVFACDYANNCELSYSTFSYNFHNTPMLSNLDVRNLDYNYFDYFSDFRDVNIVFDFNVYDSDFEDVLFFDINIYNSLDELIYSLYDLNGLEYCLDDFNQYPICEFEFNINDIFEDDGNYYYSVRLDSKVDSEDKPYTVSEVFGIDRVKPILSISDYDSNFRNTVLDLEIMCLDEFSGCSRIYYSIDLDPTDDNNFSEYELYVDPITFDEDGNFAIRYYGEDLSGNFGDVNENYFLFDFISPQVSLNGCEGGTAPSSGSSITLQCLDSLSSCDKIYYRVNEGVYTQYTSQINIPTTQTINYYAKDVANNQSITHSFTCNIERTFTGGGGDPPVLSGLYVRDFDVSPKPMKKGLIDFTASIRSLSNRSYNDVFYKFYISNGNFDLINSVDMGSNIVDSVNFSKYLEDIIDEFSFDVIENGKIKFKVQISSDFLADPQSDNVREIEVFVDYIDSYFDRVYLVSENGDETLIQSGSTYDIVGNTYRIKTQIGSNGFSQRRETNFRVFENGVRVLDNEFVFNSINNRFNREYSINSINSESINNDIIRFDSLSTISLKLLGDDVENNNDFVFYLNFLPVEEDLLVDERLYELTNKNDFSFISYDENMNLDFSVDYKKIVNLTDFQEFVVRDLNGRLIDGVPIIIKNKSFSYYSQVFTTNGYLRIKLPNEDRYDFEIKIGDKKVKGNFLVTLNTNINYDEFSNLNSASIFSSNVVVLLYGFIGFLTLFVMSYIVYLVYRTITQK